MVVVARVLSFPAACQMNTRFWPLSHARRKLFIYWLEQGIGVCLFSPAYLWLCVSVCTHQASNSLSWVLCRESVLSHFSSAHSLCCSSYSPLSPHILYYPYFTSTRRSIYPFFQMLFLCLFHVFFFLVFLLYLSSVSCYTIKPLCIICVT